MKTKISKILFLSILIFSFTLTTTSCKEAKKAALKTWIEKYQATLPQNVGDGIIITDVALDGDCLVYTASVDESQCDLSAIEANKELIKTEMAKEFKSDSDIQEVVSTGVSVKYKYIGQSSGTTCEIFFTNSELQK